ncbi:VMAP-C domain-containing protein [Streptomyces rubiginosohelvolus]|uniref:VMAP-C domain-containing protein n=1 Tax=Streptomyces rubiginosohelvolus TaxID=67362 RepID=UPI003678236E
MTPPHDWQRTHAVIVAVESYADEAWNLSGPASDAARVMRWLTARGVPESGMHLLASPLAKNEGHLAGFSGVRRRTADRAQVRKVFREELKPLDVDWLWVYWAGHGLQMGGNRWGLLYPDSRTGDPLGLDAENLVSLLRTEHLPARQPDRVTIVIDACRSTLSVGEQARTVLPELIATVPEKGDRKLFVMRASRPGGAAKNTDGAGVFTSSLMDRLEAGSREDREAAPDLTQVWKEVRTEFARRKEAGHGGQTPTVYLRDWDDNDSTYPGGAVNRPILVELSREQALEREKLVLRVDAALADKPGLAARLAADIAGQTGIGPPCPAAELDGDELVDWCLSGPHGVSTLIHLLSQEEACGADGDALRLDALRLTRGRWLLCSEYDALSRLLADLPTETFRAFVTAAHEEVPRLVFGETEPLALIDHLEDLWVESPQLRRLIGAVERLAASVGGALAEQLRKWTLNCATRLGPEVLTSLRVRRLELDERAAHSAVGEGVPAPEDRIQIRLSAATGSSGQRTLQAWVRGSAGSQSLATHDLPLPETEIHQVVDDLLTRHGRVHVTPVEFFLDLVDLELDVHGWEIRGGGPFPRRLGVEFPVVIRCAEYRLPQREHLWQQRWKRVADGRTEDLHWLPDGPATSEAVYSALSAMENVPGVVVPAAGEARTHAFAASVYGGVPVMVWRNGPETEGSERELSSFLESDSLISLPGKLRRIRSVSAADAQRPGSRLALLWDDPDHPLPPPLGLAAP